MININQKLVEMLDDSEMWVIIHIANVLNKDTNDVDLMNQTLVKKTGYSIGRLNKIKASLVAKKVLKITSRKRFDGGTACNNYAINSKFVTLYLGKKEDTTPPIKKMGGLCPNDIGGEYTKQEGGGYQNEYPLYTPIEFTNPVEFNYPVEEPQTPKGASLDSKIISEVEPEKKRRQSTPRAKFEPDLSRVYDDFSKALIQKFIDYRIGKKKGFKTQIEVDTFIDLLLEFSENNPKQAEQIINYSIAGGYPGIYKPNKPFKNGKPQESNDEYKQKIYGIAGDAIAGAEKSRIDREERERRIRESSPGY